MPLDSLYLGGHWPFYWAAVAAQSLRLSVAVLLPSAQLNTNHSDIAVTFRKFLRAHQPRYTF